MLRQESALVASHDLLEKEVRIEKQAAKFFLFIVVPVNTLGHFEYVVALTTDEELKSSGKSRTFHTLRPVF